MITIEEVLYLAFQRNLLSLESLVNYHLGQMTLDEVKKEINIKMK